MTTKLFGERVERREDGRLLTGAGRFTDDLAHDAAQAAFVRSDFAHARICDIDVSGALDVAGVLGVYTYDDLQGGFAERLPLLIPHRDLKSPRTQYALARNEVCYAGEVVAMVVARDRYIAEDAAQAIRIEYEPLPVVVDLEQAVAVGSPLTHSDAADNVAAHVSEMKGDVDGVLGSAPHVFKWRFRPERSASMPMEGRAVFARYDSGQDTIEVYDSTQAPTGIRAGLAELFELDWDRVHVIAPDVGGGFGVKVMQFYPEEVLVPWASRQLGMPVKWTEDRREHFIGSNQERGQIHDVRVGVDAEGRILTLDVRFLHDTGAYCPYGLIVPIITAAQLPGPYRLANYRYSFWSVFTNTVPVSPYRGAGRPQAVFVMERVIERVAHELGLDSLEVRRRNFIQPDQFPYDVGVSWQDGGPTVYDSGDYPGGFQLLLDSLGLDGARQQQAEARAEGRLVGLGVGCYVEGTGIGPYEGATIAILPDGTVSAATGLSTQGQGHETIFAQIVADELGVPLERISVTTGDTRRIGFGVGTFASRSAVVAGHAMLRAARSLREQTAKLASTTLEVAVEDLVFEAGAVHVRGVPEKSVPLGRLTLVSNPLRYAYGRDARFAAELAQRAYAKADRPLPEGSRPGLSALEYYSPAAGVFGFGMHAALVEVDRRTCNLKILRYVIVHDCGRIINPLIVDGQVLGGLAQGIGGAFYERIHYSPEGQIQNASFMDFLIPYATEIPPVELHHLETPSPRNELGVKGVGEAGTIPVPAVIANGLSDALGVPIDHVPLSPEELFQILHREPA
ncbi:MAG: aerobic carbon-monoxide dehydrogenase large subunit [Candidatus Dormibacter sp.]|uniref:aerobic carbon-monoxide dehydrogenase large subunit n=1 Tax=Candidatus Dormibacter sp. TaxID=2973982 RepID=UPI000DB385B8|nr:MAG: xanthine dehydrogenase [Candidatus Dormibacteraeota bacterium]